MFVSRNNFLILLASVGVASAAGASSYFLNKSTNFKHEKIQLEEKLIDLQRNVLDLISFSKNASKTESFEEIKEEILKINMKIKTIKEKENLTLNSSSNLFEIIQKYKEIVDSIEKDLNSKEN